MTVTSYLVTGDWRTITGDTPLDPDPYPDIVTVTGHVRFSPDDLGPRLADGTAYTIGPVTALIADGQLRDLQGREGVWLAADVDGQPVAWTAVVRLHHAGVVRTFKSRFTMAGDHHMTGAGS